MMSYNPLARSRGTVLSTVAVLVAVLTTEARGQGKKPEVRIRNEAGQTVTVYFHCDDHEEPVNFGGDRLAPWVEIRNGREEQRTFPHAGKFVLFVAIKGHHTSRLVVIPDLGKDPFLVTIKKEDVMETVRMFNPQTMKDETKTVSRTILRVVIPNEN